MSRAPRVVNGVRTKPTGRLHVVRQIDGGDCGRGVGWWMPWARLDDAMLDNDKIVHVGTLGFALHVAGILHCSRNLTDGFVPAGKVPTLLDFTGLRTTAAAVLERLLTSKPAPLWHRDEERDGYVIHDYLKYNPSREQAFAKRDAARDRQGRHRAVTQPVTPDVTRMSRRDFAADSRPPVPVPVPTLATDVASVPRAPAIWGQSMTLHAIPPLPSDVLSIVNDEVRDAARVGGCANLEPSIRHWHTNRRATAGNRRTWKSDYLADLVGWFGNHSQYGGACGAKPASAVLEQPTGLGAEILGMKKAATA